MRSKEFVVTNEHVALLRHANVGWNEVEWGAPGLDTKRPFGNGDLYGDMMEILGIEHAKDDDWDPPEDVLIVLRKLYQELEVVLQIVLRTGELHAGLYERSSDYGTDWRLTAE